MNVRPVAHLIAVPQRAGEVDALEPGDPVEGIGDEQEDILRAPLALRGRAMLVVDPRAAEQRDIDRPAVAGPVADTDAAQSG